MIIASKQYLLNGADIVCTDVFKKFSTLVGIQLDNRDLVVFTIHIGTTSGGSEIGDFTLDGTAANFFSINQAFDSAQTVYISGLTGHDTDVSLVYYQLDENRVTFSNEVFDI
ncbi:hypothetical protein SNE25_08170 [Mucilaginibacter sabulilitoris]|uniref:Uncharacterized protein n=1 Tax=Mucilaginibacter sabulilitoris TaxID=1173583 RepID=A0ABZ0TSQ9_9SPHI|nr:hypothetical protein [Mucilaginibacter sabulilitoris]WPU95497.1 hypothetical protein SNE25_08170 [Mucilaginibacter sabulilitoris]